MPRLTELNRVYLNVRYKEFAPRSWSSSSDRDLAEGFQQPASGEALGWVRIVDESAEGAD